MNIHESDTVESLALVGEFDAKVWAHEFVQAVTRTPEIATDEETMLAWFSVAIMAGYDKASAAPEQGLDRSVRLRDVVEAIESRDPALTTGAMSRFIRFEFAGDTSDTEAFKPA
jgi:hypothetical protein